MSLGMSLCKFSKLTKKKKCFVLYRQQDKIVQRSGQKVVDPTSGDGQYPVDPIVYPTKEVQNVIRNK